MIIRATCVCIEKNSLLLIRQHFRDIKREWSLPGGKVEEGESLFTAVKREVHEETGIVVVPKKVLYITEDIRSKHIVHILINCSYVCGIPGEGQQLTNSESISDVQFVSINKLPDYGFSQTFLQLVHNGFPEPVFRGLKANIGL